MTGVGHKEVTITTTKDFAGQMVNVTRTVAVGSDEHKKLMQVTAYSSFCSCFVVYFFLFSFCLILVVLHCIRNPRARAWSLCWG